MIWWAGRRYDDPLRKLVPFGHFEHLIKINGTDTRQMKRTYWEQELNVDGGFVRTKSFYGGIQETTTSFVPLGNNVVVVHTEIRGAGDSPKNGQLSFRYALHETMNEEALPRRMTIDPRWNPELDAVEISYQVDGSKRYEGTTALFSDAKVSSEIRGNKYNLHAESRDTLEASFFLLFMDDEDGLNYLEEATKQVKILRSEGYPRIFEKNASDWKQFWSRSYVNLPDKDLVDVWRTCLYHIRSQTTKWSVPVAILETHWWGKFFHDELFSHLALLSSNQMELAERIPIFRRRTLDRALKVTGGTGARYSWESTEDGEEGAPPGPWLYEIHHEAVIASECWTHYLYSQDKKFLETVYQVIKQCAEYIRQWHVYKTDTDRASIGACTDLDESMSPVRNPIYSCCGAIRTFLAAAEASEILGADEELRAVWKGLAKKLLNNLAFDGEKYVPFEGARHQSLPVLGIIFPFSVLDPKDQRVRKSVLDYMERCRSTVGWRPTSRAEKDAFFLLSLFSEDVMFVGEGENWIWNSAWLATCLARMGDRTHTYDVLKKILQLTDTFGSVSEAKSSKRTVHHWFTTAAGAYVYALNEMLLQSTPEEIKLLPAIPPAWSNLSFKLRCQGNAVVEAKVVEGVLRELLIDSPIETVRKIIIPRQLVGKEYVSSGGEVSFTTEDQTAVLQARFKGTLTVKFGR